MNSIEKLLSLEESDLDIILASIPLGTRRLVKRAWLDTRPSRGRVSARLFGGALVVLWWCAGGLERFGTINRF